MRAFKISPWTDPQGRSMSKFLTTCLQPNCQFQVTDRTEASGLRGIEIHSCPYYVGKVKVSWVSHGPTLLQQLWDEADSKYAEFRPLKAGEGHASEVAILQGQLRGLAFALSLFMQPHLTSVADVSREVAKRYQMKQAGEEYETPGLGSRIYEPPPGDHKYATRTSAPLVDISGIDEQTRSNIKNFHKHFGTAKLADTYDLTHEQVLAVMASG